MVHAAVSGNIADLSNYGQRESIAMPEVAGLIAKAVLFHPAKSSEPYTPIADGMDWMVANLMQAGAGKETAVQAAVGLVSELVLMRGLLGKTVREAGNYGLFGTSHPLDLAWSSTFDTHQLRQAISQRAENLRETQLHSGTVNLGHGIGELQTLGIGDSMFLEERQENMLKNLYQAFRQAS